MAEENTNNQFQDQNEAQNQDASKDDAQQGNKTDNQQQITPEKKYSDSEVDEIVKSKFAKWQIELEKQKDEAKKLAKMNSEEKLQHELDKKDKEIADLRKKESIREMSKEASKMLSDANLPYDEELVDLLTNEDAEVTKKAINTIINYVAKFKKESVRQSTPNEGGAFNSDKKGKLTYAEMAQENRIIK